MTDRSALRLVRRGAAVTALMTISVVVTLAILEAALRIVDGVRLLSRENFVARDLNFIPKALIAGYDARLGWVQLTNVYWAGNGLRYTFGDLGVRMAGPEFVPLKQGAIVVVGDSFAAGSDVTDAASWPAQLERMIAAPVINAAVGGYGVDQIVLRAEDLIPRLKPRMLLVQTRLEYGLSANRMSILGGAPKPYFVVRGDELVLENEPVPQAAAKSSDIGWARSIFGHSYLVHYAMTRLDLLQWWVAQAMGTKYVLSNAESVDVTCLLMRRLAGLRDRYSIPISLVSNIRRSTARPRQYPRKRTALA